MAEELQKTLKEILSEAKEAEQDKNVEGAISLYQQAITTDKLNQVAYDRLMMLFRKQKNYKKELAIIKDAIKVFEEFYKSKIPRKSKTITDISNKLIKSLSLADKKGNNLYSPEPIATWQKRKVLVEKKIK